MAGLKVSGVTKTFGDFVALSDVTLDVAEGEFLAVLGPSGCGKTTLLRMIAGFESVTGGEVAIGGKVVSSPRKEVPPEKRRVGIVFQNYALWPHMTVADNVGYSLRVAKVPKADRERRVHDALALVEMTAMAGRMPGNLSGGQRQRVALARCLVAEPALVLFDEPLANLDVHLRASMEDEFARFHKRTGTTIVYITHDQSEAMALADRIAVMDKGRLMQLDTPQALYHRPANEMVASFISQGMVLPAQVTSAEADGQCRATVLGCDMVVNCQTGEQPRSGAKVCCRSENLRICSDNEPGADGVISRVIYRGGSARIEFIADLAPETVIHFEQADPVTFENGQRARLAFTTGWLIPRGDDA
jgi:iron(III) transport system ATP-binding protein